MDFEDKIFELQQELKESRDKELIYLNILQEIDSSIKTLFQREEENERFKLGEEFNFRDNLINLQSYLNECKRIYKIRL